MEIKTNYPSPLEMKSIIITDCHFHREDTSFEKEQISLQVNRSIQKLEQNDYRLELEAILVSENHNLEVSVKCAAVFCTAQDNVTLVERNAVAIVFPYVRSYISSVTTQPGLMPIVLPPLNIAAMFQDKT